MFALGELATYAQESLPITLMVVDDGGYGMLRFDQQVFGHPERGVDLLTPEWAILGAAFGIASEDGRRGRGQSPAHCAGPARRTCAGSRASSCGAQRLFPPRTTSPRWFE